MKKFLSIITLFFVSGCSVAKPVVLNASMPNLINKAYNTTNTRNGTNNFLIVNGGRTATTYATAFEVDNVRYTFDYMIYVCPITNPLKFDYVKTRENRTYFEADCSLPYNIKSSLRLREIDADNNLTTVFDITQTMLLASDVEQYKIFRGYHLPFDMDSWQANPRSYIVNQEISFFFQGTGNFTIEPETTTLTTYDTRRENNQIYYYQITSNEIADTKTTCWQSPYLFFDWVSYSPSQNVTAALIQRLKQRTGANTSYEKVYFTFQYDMSISEELTAYKDGWEDGIDESENGVGTSWVKQALKAVQAFLDIDLGFFKLGHILGGLAVIAIVIFVVRWFR